MRTSEKVLVWISISIQYSLAAMKYRGGEEIMFPFEKKRTSYRLGTINSLRGERCGKKNMENMDFIRSLDRLRRKKKVQSSTFLRPKSVRVALPLRTRLQASRVPITRTCPALFRSVIFN